MGFDNECILNIQSLAGEYFCPVCRTLVYPHEAIQTQCTHLYCKPCLTYVVGSTQACPYDGYLVTESSSKPLMESNKTLADTIGKTTVHCLYHRSGCVWQGPLSETTSHCSGCSFGNSPVVCNRCGIQIVHRQVQEHAQTCNVNGANTNSQPLGSETVQDTTVSVDQTKIANQPPPPQPPVSQPQPPPQPQPSHTATVPSTVQMPPTNPIPQTAPATEQWYQQQQQQQYQQYYQQYPGYDPYQQPPYQQQYYPYQQPPQNQPPPPQSQPQIQPPIQPPPQFQTQPPISTNGQPQPQPLYPQATVVNPQQNQLPVHGHIPPQSYSQVQPQIQVPQYQQPYPQVHHSQPPQVQPPPPPHPHFQSQPVINPPVQSVYPSQPIQHPPPPQQYPMAGSLPPPQFPQPPSYMRPTQPPPHMLPSQAQIPSIHPHNQPGQRPVQQPMTQQYVQQPPPQPFPGQTPPPHSSSFQPQVRPPQPMQPPPLGFVQPQLGTTTPLPHGMPAQSQTYMGRPNIPPHTRPPPPQFVPSQQSNNGNMTNQPPHVYSEQQPNQYPPPLSGAVVDRKVEQQEDKSPSLIKSETGANEFRAKVKTETGNGNGNGGEDEALTKDVPGDSVTTQRLKEEVTEGASDHNKAEDSGVDSMKQVEPHGSSEVNNDRTFIQPQTTAPSGHGYLPPGHGHPPPGPHPGDHFPPSQSHARLPRMSQGEPSGPPPLPHGHGPDGQTVPRHPSETNMYQNQRPSHLPFGGEPNSMRMNGGPLPGHHDTLSAPVFRDEKFNTFPMGQGEFKGNNSPRFGTHSSRPLSGYGMDGHGPSMVHDKDPHGYGSGGRPHPPNMHDDNRGRFEHNRLNPDFHGPMRGFGRHHMDPSPRHPSRSFGGGPPMDVDVRERERHSFGERFFPPGHMHRGEFDRNRPHVGEPGFRSFHDYREPGFNEPFGAKSARPHLGEPGFRSSYSRHGFPPDGGFFTGGSGSYDGIRKRKVHNSMGWCRICKIDCESVEGLDMHGQTREHQRMAMDMVMSIKQNNAKKQNEHSGREEPGKLRITESHVI